MKSSFFGLVAVAGLGLILDPHMSAAQMCSDGATEGVDGNGVVCCPIGCSVCAGSGCSSAGLAAGLDADDCCGSNIKENGVYCDDNGNVAPCILGTGLSTCSDGTPGVDDGNGKVCCSIGCSQCAGPGCSSAGLSAGLGASDCCGGAIKSSGVYCADTGEAPCILSAGEGVCSDGVTEGVDGNGVVCCPLGCSQCSGPGCSSAGEDCCGGPIKESGVYCDDNGNQAPCILGSINDASPTPSPADDEMCSDGVTEGVDGNGVVCCTTGCTKCGGAGCTTAGVAAGLDADDCCGSNIKENGEYCDDNGNVAPCIIGSIDDTPAPTPAPVAPTPAPTDALVGCDAPDIVQVLAENSLLACCPLECGGEVDCCDDQGVDGCDGLAYPCVLFLADDFGLILIESPLDALPTLPPSEEGMYNDSVTAVPEVATCGDLIALTELLGLEGGSSCCAEEDCGVGLPDRRALVEAGPTNSRALQNFFPVILLPQCNGLETIPCIFGVVISGGSLWYVNWVAVNCILIIIITGFAVVLLEICLPSPTLAPTPAPTLAPTPAPTLAPTPAPTIFQSVEPTTGTSSILM